VFALADRVLIMRLGQRVAVVTPATCTMETAVAIMTGARAPDSGRMDPVRTLPADS
jgi:fructose transport system ATP-binding protein